MEKAIQKPRFEEVKCVTEMRLPDEKLIFNAQEVGPTNFNGLRNADYGKGFRMPTMPELIPLIYASLENKDYETAKNVIKTLKNSWITGNTAIHYFPKAMFVQDNPKMKDGKIILLSQKTLEKKLGKNQEKEVIFSEDKKTRFVPYSFKIEHQTPLELSQNLGIIALVGGKENTEKLAKVSEYYKLKPYFWTLENVNSPKTRVADLGSGSFDDRLDVYAYVSEGYGDRYSFGVLENSAKALRRKNS